MKRPPSQINYAVKGLGIGALVGVVVALLFFVGFSILRQLFWPQCAFMTQCSQNGGECITCILIAPLLIIVEFSVLGWLIGLFVKWRKSLS